MQLSSRLQAVADLVTPGTTLADIGTDHAYIPIALVKSGRIPRAFAMDIHRGPLARAEENIRTNGLEEWIETRLSDGLAKLDPGEAESILIAGMGGALTIRILENGAEVVGKARELILQPQSEVPEVRKFLEETGWTIAQENMVLEEQKYYPMMRAVPADAPKAMSELQCRFGPKLLEMHHPVLYEFLLHEERVEKRVLGELENGRDEKAQIRRQEIEEELRLSREALQLYQ